MRSGAPSPGERGSAGAAAEGARAELDQASTAATPSTHEVGEPIALASHPGILITVKRVEWHDRMQVEDGEGTRYVDPVLGGFLLVQFEIVNQTTGAIVPTELSMPVLEDEAGRRFQPSLLPAVVVIGQQSVRSSIQQAIEPGSIGTHIEFFDVPLGFEGGYLRAEADNYRVAVGRAH